MNLEQADHYRIYVTMLMDGIDAELKSDMDFIDAAMLKRTNMHLHAAKYVLDEFMLRLKNKLEMRKVDEVLPVPTPDNGN